MTIWAIVPAAGIGRRMGSITPKQPPKQYLPLLGVPVLAHSLNKLLAVPAISRIVVVLHPEDSHFGKLEVAADARIGTALGSDTRQGSVLNGLAKLTAAHDQDWVLIHDAVRPCVKPVDITYLLDILMDHPTGGLLGSPVDNTLKEVDSNAAVIGTADRSRFWQAYTPQMFRYGLLRQALEQARDNGLALTDEAAAIEAMGHQPQMVPGSKSNLKITHDDDLVLAEKILTLQGATSGEQTS